MLRNAEFIADLSSFLKPLAWPAVAISLAHTLIKCTAPGIPDIYQGADLWDLNLVDPDNRRPVDFERRKQFLQEIQTLSLDQILHRHAEGLPKLFLLQRVLSLRKQFPEAFGPQGNYRPINAKGENAGRLVAFIRGGQVATVAPRRLVGLEGKWGDTAIRLPEGIWKDEFSGTQYGCGWQQLSRILAEFPVALLVRTDRL